MSQYAPPTGPGYTYTPSPSTGMAIAAMVLSIVGLCVTPLALVGLILGIIALVNANKNPGEHGGKGMAIAGIVVGGVALLISVVWLSMMAGILLPALGKARQNAQQIKSGSQMRSIGLALDSYSLQHDAYPEFGANIVNRLGSEAPAELFASPIVGRGSTTVSYLYCAGLDGTNPNAVLMFENPAINPRGINVLYQDGHIEFIRAADIPTTLAGVQNVQTTDGQPFTVQLPK